MQVQSLCQTFYAVSAWKCRKPEEWRNEKGRNEGQEGKNTASNEPERASEGTDRRSVAGQKTITIVPTKTETGGKVFRCKAESEL